MTVFLADAPHAQGVGEKIPSDEIPEPDPAALEFIRRVRQKRIHSQDELAFLRYADLLDAIKMAILEI
jgi:hypothetical protein